MYKFYFDDIDGKQKMWEAAFHVNVNCPLHLHHRLEIVFVKSGLLKMHVNNSERIMRGGECTIVLPFEYHSFETPDESECYVIVFSQNFVPDFYSLIKDKAPELPTCKLPHELLKVCGGILTDSACTDELQTKAVIYLIGTQIYNNCRFTESKKHFEQIFIEAVHYVEENFTDEISLTTASKALGVHHAYLSRIFKQNSGISFTRYLNSTRCFYAAQLLKEEGRTVSETAYEAGFGSIRSFNRAFNETFHTSPRRFNG